MKIIWNYISLKYSKNPTERKKLMIVPLLEVPIVLVLEMEEEEVILQQNNLSPNSIIKIKFFWTKLWSVSINRICNSSICLISYRRKFSILSKGQEIPVVKLLIMWLKNLTYSTIPIITYCFWNWIAQLFKICLKKWRILIFIKRYLKSTWIY